MFIQYNFNGIIELGLQRQATTLSEFDTAGHGWLSRSETLDEIADENGKK